MSSDVVKLPESLNDCGCEYANMGRHKTSCIPARAWDAFPLTEREGYAPGVRFQAISWDYPLSIGVTFDCTVDIDPAAFISSHRQQYEEFEVPPEFEEYEKPLVFIESFIWDVDPTVEMPFGGRRAVSAASGLVSGVSEHPRWTPEDYDKLTEAIGPWVHPDQGALFQA